MINFIRVILVYYYLLNYPLKIYSIFERHLNEMAKDIKGEKITA